MLRLLVINLKIAKTQPLGHSRAAAFSCPPLRPTRDRCGAVPQGDAPTLVAFDFCFGPTIALTVLCRRREQVRFHIAPALSFRARPHLDVHCLMFEEFHIDLAGFKERSNKLALRQRSGESVG